MYREFIKVKSGVELSRSAWTGSKVKYYEPLGWGPQQDFQRVERML